MITGAFVKSSLVIVALLLSAPNLLGEVSVRATVDRNKISEGETIDFSILISGDVSRYPNIQLPDLGDFGVYSSGTSQNFTWVNGRSEQTKNYNFTLLPTKLGQLSIPPLQIEVDGRTHSTQAIPITVSGRSAPQARSTQPNRTQQRTRPTQRTSLNEDDLFVRATVDKKTVYVNEQVTLSFKFFQGVEVLDVNYTPPQKTGFWAEELPPQKRSYQNVNGRDYSVTEIFTGLFPTSPGTQTVGSAQLSAVVELRDSNDPFSFFGGFFRQRRTIALQSDPVEITTLPLPTAGKPEDFSGTVGQYRMNVSVDKNKVEVNEPVTMKIRISGIGNIKSIALPTIEELADFRSYTAGDSETVEKVNYRVGGVKVFEQAFIPKRSGSYLLPALKFSYFDPETKSYNTLSSEPIHIEVSPSKDRFSSQMQNLQTNRIDLAAKDIRYLKSEIGNIQGRRARPYAMSPLFLAFYLLPIVGYVVVLSRQRHKDRMESDQGFRRLRQARKMAEAKLSRARKVLDDKNADAFYAETSRALIDYFADRYNLPSYGLTSDKIREFAEGKQSDEMISRMLQMLQQCDFGRFAPGGSDQPQMEKLWQEARQLIVDLEKTR